MEINKYHCVIDMIVINMYYQSSILREHNSLFQLSEHIVPLTIKPFKFV